MVIFNGCARTIALGSERSNIAGDSYARLVIRPALACRNGNRGFEAETSGSSGLSRAAVRFPRGIAALRASFPRVADSPETQPRG